jgi:hypothetical protein
MSRSGRLETRSGADVINASASGVSSVYCASCSPGTPLVSLYRVTAVRKANRLFQVPLDQSTDSIL